MKVSLKWLQKYFDAPLPDRAAVADAFTFHAFEIEDQVAGEPDDLLDVKVLPNRAADCLSHRGLACELAAILDLPLKTDPLALQGSTLEFGAKVEPLLSVHIEDPKKCARYLGALVKNVKVGPSPDWLREALESVGQRSINNVVDATNYVMLNVGQPLHAFDAAKLTQKDGAYAVGVRAAREGEKITTLSGEPYELDSTIQVIVDASGDVPIAIAGIKGGDRAAVTNETTELVVESANFDGTTTRRAAQKLKLFTDASQRFQNRPSPELAAYGMRDVLALIVQVAGGEVVGVVDEYAARPEPNRGVVVTLAQINGLLGSSYSATQVTAVFSRLGLETAVDGETFTVTPPFERTDLVIPEDLIEEVGRISGYDQIPATELPPIEREPDQARYHGVERMKDQLIAEGYTEVSTQSFAKKGDITLANPLDKEKPALRTSLEATVAEALTRAKYNAPLVLAPKQQPKLFEVGSVFAKAGEYLELRMSEPVKAWGEMVTDNLSVAKLEDYGRDYTPKRYELGAYQPFSAYPFITRDIALWVPTGTDYGLTLSIIKTQAGDLLMRIDQFDQFEKEGRVSLAYRLVFQSPERTLTDAEVNDVMLRVSTALTEKGYEVR